MSGKTFEKYDINLLYVEDEDFIREAMTEILKRRFENVSVAKNGAEGLASYNTVRPDLIITDIRMPIMTGLELAKEIRMKDNTTQIIVTSAYSDTEFLVSAIELGINHYVFKPIDKALLFTAVERCVEVIHLRREKERLAAELKISEINLRHRNQAIEKDLEKARLLQKELLPKNISLPWLKSDYRYLPFDKIGGDFLSFQTNENGNISVFISDVTGHGVSAAIFVSLVKVLTDRLFKIPFDSPLSYMLQLNKDLIEIEIPSYITALTGTFNNNKALENIVFNFSVGGHPPPIIYRKSTNTIEVPQTFGTIVGSFDLNPEDFDNLSVTLNKGDRIFLYTDGIIESRITPSIFYSVEDFAEYLGTLQNCSLSDSLDIIMKKLKDHIVNDDILLLGFECL